MKIELKRTNSEHEDFRNLVVDLEEYLTHADEEAHSKCKPYNKLPRWRGFVIRAIKPLQT